MLDDGDPVVVGERFDGVSRQARTFAAGRSCCNLGCWTRLSIYNPRNFCSLHSEDIVRRGRSDGVRASSWSKRPRQPSAAS